MFGMGMSVLAGAVDQNDAADGESNDVGVECAMLVADLALEVGRVPRAVCVFGVCWKNGT